MPYTAEQRKKATDLYFSDESMTIRKVIDELGYPSLHALNKWLLEDPRYMDTALDKRVSVKKKDVVDYCKDHPDATFADVREKFNSPGDLNTLNEWLKAAGLPVLRPVPQQAVGNQSDNEKDIVFSRETLQEAAEKYFDNPKVSIRTISNEFGVPYKMLRGVINTDSRFHKNGSGKYDATQKDEICSYAMNHPEESLCSIIKQFGYPKTTMALKKWIKDRCASAADEVVEFDDDLFNAVIEHFFSDPDATLRTTADQFDIGKDTARRWVESDPRYYSDPRRQENRNNVVLDAVECYFRDISLSCIEVAEMYGVTDSAVSARVRKDPRYDMAQTYGHTEEEKAAIENWLLGTLGSPKKPLYMRKSAEKDLGFPINNKAFTVWTNKVRKSLGLNKPDSKIAYKERLEIVFEAMEAKSDKEVALRHNISSGSLHRWKKKYREEGAIALVRKSDLPPENRIEYTLPDKQPEDFDKKDVETLIGAYKEQAFEADVYKAIVEVLKKDPSLSGELLTNREKTLVIDSLRHKYKLKDLLKKLNIAKSSYEYTRNALKKPDKYCHIRILIREIYESSGHAYGFRRITATLRDKYDQDVGTRIVRSLMQEMNIVPLPAMKLKRYNSYRGSIGRVAPNLLKRDFHADEPGEKLLTDITEFHLNGYKVYLSPLIDCFNGEVVARTISMHPTLSLVTKMIQNATELERFDGKVPLCHSDQGWHYQHPKYVKMLKEAGWVQSMSRKGCCPDNSACEGFFGRLKNEFFYNHNFEGYSPNQFMEALDKWIDWYNNERIKESLGYIPPVEYRETWEQHADVKVA